MNEKNTEYLHKACPLLYVNKRGFEHGDGWFELIKECSLELESYINSLPLDERPRFAVLQVKEKFGTLRFYLSGYSHVTERVIGVAEKKSAITCEKCGKPGRLHTEFGWYTTMCDGCVVDATAVSVFDVCRHGLKKGLADKDITENVKMIIERSFIVTPEELERDTNQNESIP